MSIEQSLERIASALERLANAGDVQISVAPALLPPAPPPEVLDREKIKAELDRLGITYPARATSETLVKKLEAAKLKKNSAPDREPPTTPAVIVDADPFGVEAGEADEAELPEVAATDLFADGAPETPAPVLDFSKFQEECKKLVAVYGKDAFLEALKKVKAAKISDIPEQKRTEFVKQLKEKV